jgi:magnesium chelatase family protein
MLVFVYGSAVFGVAAQLITMEVNIDQGIGYHLVGLPDNAVRESNFRIAAALKNIGYKLPGKKITLNMATADLRKEGSAFDIPLSKGILAASSQIKAPSIGYYILMGALALDGKIRPIKGVLPIAIQGLKDGFKGVLPKENEREAAIVKGLEVYGMDSLTEVIAFFEGNQSFSPTVVDTRKAVDQQLKYPEHDFF